MFVSYFFCYLISLTVLLIGILGCFLVKRNLILILICIELMLISVQLNFLIASYNFNDIIGQIFNLFILMVAAAEVAIGLALLIINYRLRVLLKLNSFIYPKLNMYLLSIFFPILTIIFITVSYKKHDGLIAIMFIFLSLIVSLLCSCLMLYEVVYLNSTCYIEFAPWFQIGSISVNWSFISIN